MTEEPEATATEVAQAPFSRYMAKKTGNIEGILKYNLKHQ